MRLLRYARIALIFAGASVSAQLEYRMNFLVNLVGSLLLASGSLLGLTVLFGDGQPLGGWSMREAVVVVGLFTLVEGFIGALLYPNLNKIAEAIRLGTMDFVLLKPVDSQFLVSSRNVNLFRLTDVVIGLALIVGALSGLEGVTADGLLLGTVLTCAGLLIVYSVWLGLSTTAFWFVKVENMTELFNGFFRAGQFPVSAFPGWVRFLFTFMIPVAFITTVPASAMVGRAEPRGTLGAVAVAAILFGASRWFWSYAVRKYTSASS